MLTNDFVKSQVIKLLPIDSNLYADQVDILVGGAMNKLKNEGINTESICEGTNASFDYCICCAYQVAIDIDADIDMDRLYKMYISRVNTLRTCIE